MNVWDVVKLYFLIGFVAIAIEWLILVYGKRGVLYECHEPSGVKALIVVCVFLAEIVIWPRQVLYNLWLFTRIMFGKCSQRDLEALEYEGTIADFASRNRKGDGKHKIGVKAFANVCASLAEFELEETETEIKGDTSNGSSGNDCGY